MNYKIEITISFSKYPENDLVEPAEHIGIIFPQEILDVFVAKHGHLGGVSKACNHIAKEMILKEFNAK